MRAAVRREVATLPEVDAVPAASAGDAPFVKHARRSAAGASDARRTEGMRASILKAAAALFRRQGFERTTVQSIADAVGLKKGSLYHYITGKQRLLFEILQHALEHSLPALERIASSPSPAAERLRAAVRLHILTLARDRDNVACFLEEGRWLAPEYRAAHQATRDRYEGCYRRIIADGIATGEFAPTDVRLAGFAVLGIVNWVVRWYRPEGRLHAEEIAGRFGDYAVGVVAGGRERDGRA